MSNDTSSQYHVPVMLNEAVDGLNIIADGIYVDCTFGGGSHSKSILNKLNEQGRLIAFDQDADAKINIPSDPRITFISQNFRDLQRFLRLNKIDKVMASWLILEFQVIILINLNAAFLRVMMVRWT